MWIEIILLFVLIVLVFSFGYMGMRLEYKKHEKMFKSLEKIDQSWMIFYREQAGFRLRMLLKQKLSQEDLKLLKETESRFLDEHEKRFRKAVNL